MLVTICSSFLGTRSNVLGLRPSLNLVGIIPVSKPRRLCDVLEQDRIINCRQKLLCIICFRRIADVVPPVDLRDVKIPHDKQVSVTEKSHFEAN